MRTTFRHGSEPALIRDALPRSPTEHLVEISRHVSFAYDAGPILTGIDMVIPRGKVVAIMGVSGSGKTTLLRLIAGVLKPTRGR